MVVILIVPGAVRSVASVGGSIAITRTVTNNHAVGFLLTSWCTPAVVRWFPHEVIGVQRLPLSARIPEFRLRLLFCRTRAMLAVSGRWTRQRWVLQFFFYVLHILCYILLFARSVEHPVGEAKCREKCIVIPTSIITVVI